MRGRHLVLVLCALSVVAAVPVFPSGSGLTTDGLRIDLCGPATATAGVPMGFIGRLTVSDQHPTSAAPFGLEYFVYVSTNDGQSGWVGVRPDGWFQFALLPQQAGDLQVTAALSPVATQVQGTSWTVSVAAGEAPSGLTAEIHCYLAYRDASHAELYLVVGGVMGHDVVHEDNAPVGGVVHIDAGQPCWTSIPFCDQTIDHQSAGFSMLIAPNRAWETAERPWAAWAGPFYYWAGTPVVPGCAPTLWVDGAAYVTTVDGTFRAPVADLERDACEPGASSGGP